MRRTLGQQRAAPPAQGMHDTARACRVLCIGGVTSHLRADGAGAVGDEDEGLAEGDLLVEGEAARGKGGAHLG